VTLGKETCVWLPWEIPSQSLLGADTDRLGLSSIVPQTSTNVFIERPFVEAAQEMKGKFWGPVSVKEFFDQFFDMKTTDLMPEID
jgi:hypothetical protein